MTRVLVVFTIHRETGLASASEVDAFLERIRPDVIFLELPAVDVDRFLDGTHGTPDSIAASRYRVRHPVTIVAVDTPAPTMEFAQRMNYLFDRIEEASPESCRLSYLHRQQVSTRGFPYLNSAEGKTLWAAIQNAQRAAVEELHDPTVRELYVAWAHANDIRETAMLNSILDHAQNSPFETGVFFVGLAHQESLAHKVQSRPNAQGVQWLLGAFRG